MYPSTHTVDIISKCIGEPQVMTVMPIIYMAHCYFY